ncbi:hypothetical protein PILCRDRAFT_812841 [Piloderma croceum F 1598]|uniref:Uncharacterized protein n=1 Tax=Piloderma croceum (strain F 1598) TaxID=765440 RepID=A0A0C3CJX5_PILCF|nr:hypothetical protein PILCRDRAFT_812841 [Piloderma croceum F 1598]
MLSMPRLSHRSGLEVSHPSLSFETMHLALRILLFHPPLGLSLSVHKQGIKVCSAQSFAQSGGHKISSSSSSMTADPYTNGLHPDHLGSLQVDGVTTLLSPDWHLPTFQKYMWAYQGAHIDF